MPPTNRDIRRRVCIWYEYKLGNSGTTAKANLDRVFGDTAPSQSSIWRWYRKFREGDESLDVNTERYSLVDDDELETLKKDNPELTLADLAARFGVGSSTIWNHLNRIAKGKKMKFVAKKHEQPVSAAQLISTPERRKYYPGAIPQQFVFRSTVIPEADLKGPADLKRPKIAEEAQDNDFERMACGPSIDDRLREEKSRKPPEGHRECTESGEPFAFTETVERALPI
ncbi:hypothetical protein ANCCAN_07459 [Ancylostoma caninum]|uniref:Mos1 transposase HTH domain-containing protein n=1 Tax=Ancylostoma caninum TaxID=29170 RepID=A0A368GQ27_ANCCA|nr:hypothetical protein ANCCAN_07459 [Ancylostoma caninum]